MDDSPGSAPLPSHSELRDIALAIEAAGMAGEIMDPQFRVIWTSSEMARILDVEAESLAGLSIIRRNTDGTNADIVRTTPESSVNWWRHNVPIMRHYLAPDSPEFEDVFGMAAEAAAGVDPIENPPRAWHDLVSMEPGLRMRRYLQGDSHQIQIRLNDDDGNLIGLLWLSRGSLSDSLTGRLAYGDEQLFRRMDRVYEPARRASAIMFADLEASGALAKRLSSRGYFELIRGLTDLIDSAVIANQGIVGKHAGDGGSALFLAEDFDESESSTARAAIDAARMIQSGAQELGEDDVPVVVNIGLHWGATLMIGQVATRGRLEVTALGEQMNECARIEAAAKNGAVLAAKDLLERLAGADCEATGIDPDSLAYTPLAELPGVSEKAVRDAGAIAVARI